MPSPRGFGRKPKHDERLASRPKPEASPGAPVRLRADQRRRENQQTKDPRIADIVAEVHPKVVRSIDAAKAADMERPELFVELLEFLESPEADLPDLAPQDRPAIVDKLIDEIKGLGPLEPLFGDPAVSDILVNGMKSVFVERGGQLEPVDVRFRDEAHLLRIAQKIAGWVGRRVDEASPLCDARLPDGSRVNLVIPPLAIDGASISIRRFVVKGIDLERMIELGVMAPPMARLLSICVRSRLNVLISGGTGTGKTTMLNALSREIGAGERIVTIEDAAELQIQQPHVVRLETRAMSAEGTGLVTIRDLMINALRMRPDRIIVGEVRGDEANEMLIAMNTGHPGSMGTIHANTPRDALTRLEGLLMRTAGEVPLTVMRRQIASGIDAIVQVDRLRSGRRCVTSITDIVGMENDIVTTEEIWRRIPGEDSNRFESFGRQPSWAEAIEAAGMKDELLETLRAGEEAA